MSQILTSWSTRKDVRLWTWLHLHCVKMWRFSGPYFHSFKLNMEIYGVNLCIQSKCEKIRTRKTPNMGTFHLVLSTEDFMQIWLKRTKLLMDILKEIALNTCFKYGTIIQTYYICSYHSFMFEMKATNTRGHQYAIKIRHSNITIWRNYFAFRVESV